MRSFISHLKRKLALTCSLAGMLYTSGHRKGCRHHLLHFFTCLTVSLIFGLFLFLILLFSLDYGWVVSSAISGACVALTASALFFSKRIRCFMLLFLVSCFMKQGRNLLITAGTALVVFWNIRNTFNNLRKLSSSMVCNLEKKRLSMDTSPLSDYINMVKWVNDKLKVSPDFVVVKFQTELYIRKTVESGNLKDKLARAAEQMSVTAEQMNVTMHIVLSVAKKVAPALGFAVVAIVTALVLRRYCSNWKFDDGFITSRFVEYDEKQRCAGKASVLPLSGHEAKRYIRIPCARPRAREAKLMLKFFIPVLTHLVSWLLFIALDVLLYWFIVIISSHLRDLEPFRIPLVVALRKNSEVIGIHIGGQDVEQGFPYSVTLFEKDCLPEAELLVHHTATPLLVILGVLVLLSLLSAKMQQLQVLLCQTFYGDVAERRIQRLHAKILRKRSKVTLGSFRAALQHFVKQRTFWFPILFEERRDDKVHIVTME